MTMNNKKPRIRLAGNQTGLVSILVTMIIMIVLGLIILGFARITRREQRQVLDRQLNTQAYYAAETGVNDALEAIREKLAGGGPAALDLNTSNKYTTNCSDFMNDAGLTQPAASPPNKIDGPNGTSSYTCLFVDASPTSLEYSNIGTESSQVIQVRPKAAGQINSITLSWQNKDGGTPNLAGCNNDSPPKLPEAWPANCDVGMLRVDLVPMTNPMKRDDLIDKTMTVFLYPRASAGANAINYTNSKGYGGSGKLVSVKCNGAPPANHRQCYATISGLDAEEYMLRIKSIYKASAATVTASRTGTPTALELTGGQAVIDSTGKANDVLRRIQVRVPIYTFNSPYPEFAVQSVDSICKRFALSPPDIIWDSAIGCDLLN